MSSLLMESLGWALLHSLWQGALVALLLAVALALVGRRAAHVRYALACGALVLSLALPVVSGWRHHVEARGAEASAVEPAPAPAAPRGVTGPVAVMEPVARVAVPAVPVSNDAVPADVPVLERVRSAVAGHLQWLVLAWVAGVGLCSGRMAAEWVKLRRLAREAEPVPTEWQQRLDALARKLGLGRAVWLLQSAAVDVPSAVGWLSPVVLLPVSALSGLSPRQLEMVLAHELAHIRRHDFAVNLAQVLVETLLFYHPAVRWVSQVIRVERENCCDDIAVGASGGAVSYARALTALEALRVLPEARSPAMSALGGSLPERVRRLISAPAPRCASRWVAGASVLTLASSLAVAAPLTSLVLGRTGPESRDAVSPASVPPSLPGTAAASLSPNALLAPGNASTPPSPNALLAPGAASAPPSGGPRVPPPGAVAAPAAPLPPAPPDAPEAPPAPAPALPQAGVAPMAVRNSLTAPAVIAPIPGAMAAPRPSPAPTPAPAPSPRPGAKDDDDLDARTRVGAGQQLSVNQLVALKVAGVTPERVRELESMGYAPTVANLVSMSHAGVTPEYAKDMSARFGRKLEADDLVSMRHLGVTPAYIEALKAAGFATNDPDDLVQARAVGVDEAYVRELKTAGYSGLSLEAVSQLRAVGVDPAFLRELRDSGLKDLSIDEIVRLRAGGVDADFIKKLRDSKSK